MNSERPNFEALYKVAYRKHHELLSEIEDLVDLHNNGADVTASDVVGMVRRIHEKYITHKGNP
jgi:hypothetical protein